MLALARRLLAVAFAALVGYLSYVLVEGSRRLTRPARRAPADTAGLPDSPAALGLPFEALSIATEDGVSLAGWLIPAARETHAAVILLHGYSWDRRPQLASVVPWLRERYHVIQIDFRGHGDSDDALVTLGATEPRDVAAAVAFAQSRGFGPLALMGSSMGGAVAILAGSTLPVAAVVADAPYAHLADPIANRMAQRGWPLSHLGARVVLAGAAFRARVRLPSPIAAVARLAPRGLLMIVPREDRLISHPESLRLYEAASQPKQLWVVDEAPHAAAYHHAPEAYRGVVLEFLAGYLEGDRSVEPSVAAALV